MPTSVRAPPDLASCRNSRIRRDLPTPASPESSIAANLPSAVSASATRIAADSEDLPIIRRCTVASRRNSSHHPPCRSCLMGRRGEPRLRMAISGRPNGYTQPQPSWPTALHVRGVQPSATLNWPWHRRRHRSGRQPSRDVSANVCPGRATNADGDRSQISLYGIRYRARLELPYLTLTTRITPRAAFLR